MNRRTDKMWPDDLLPMGFFDKNDLETLNDELFSEILFNFVEHTDIEEAKSKKKNDRFFNVLQLCQSNVIDVFRRLCDKHHIYVKGTYVY